MIIGLPVEASLCRKLRLVVSEEATLWAGVLTASSTLTDFMSKAEARNCSPWSRACLSSTGTHSGSSSTELNMSWSSPPFGYKKSARNSWNLTALAPASAATSMSLRALSRFLSKFDPISAITYGACAPPTGIPAICNSFFNKVTPCLFRQTGVVRLGHPPMRCRVPPFLCARRCHSTVFRLPD